MNEKDEDVRACGNRIKPLKIPRIQRNLQFATYRVESLWKRRGLGPEG